MYKAGQLITVNRKVYRVKDARKSMLRINHPCTVCPEKCFSPVHGRPCFVCADTTKMPDWAYFERV